MKHGYALMCLAAVFLALPAGAQTTISAGMINQYAKVTGINTTKDRLRVTAGVFAAKDRVLVIQMKGASVNTTNTVSYGTITALNGAGNYEFANVEAVSNDTVILDLPLCGDFNPDDSVQLVRVPVYSGSVRVTAPLTCPAWGPGSTGGVLAFEVADTLVLDADIDVSEKGFRGAQTFANGFLCSNNTYYTAVPSEGLKGEGIAHYIPNQFYGRGKLANGGGGASAGNSGAGGGGNYGAGGNGGNQYTGCGSAADYSAIGGAALVDSTRAFIGGGGGGPQRDNGSTVYPGGNGGGIIMIKAKIIRGKSHSISANGAGVLTPVADEGTSGGGAGGSIFLVCNQYDGTLQLSAAGGDGGSTNNVIFVTYCHGPAGGGGGGVIRLSVPALPGGVTTDVTGGAAGLVLNPGSPCYNTPHESQPGVPGTVSYNFADAMLPTLGLQDTVVCSHNTSVTLDIGSGYNAILWSTGATTPSITVNSTGTYYVRATAAASGCIIFDTARITKDTMTLGPDTVICQHMPLTLSPGLSGPVTSYLWQDGSTAPSLTVTQAGRYHVTILTQSGCTLSDTILVAVDSIPPLRDTLLCGADFEVTLSLPPGHTSYLWSTGATDASITVTTAGTYTVETVTPAGCTIRDTAEVTVEAVSLGDDTLVCADISYTLVPQPAGAFTSYLWQDGSTGPDFLVDKEGVYHVTVTTAHCTLSDTVYVSVDSLPEVLFTLGDSALCEGRFILFLADYTPEGLDSLAWDFGDGTLLGDTDRVRYLYDASGTFTVKLTGHYRICPDDSFSREITVYPYPVLNIGPDTAICPGGEPVAVRDHVNGGNGAASWLWSTGETGSDILVTEPGNYYATVTINGCSTTDSIFVRRSCFLEIPNVFTPDGDGINDYFFPRELLSRAVTSFRMRVYNRWGNELFETSRTDGRGWDGRFNGQPQPQGVYVYMIEAAFTNGTAEKYQGNVTLLR